MLSKQAPRVPKRSTPPSTRRVHALFAGAVAPLSEGIRQTEQPLDAQGRRRGKSFEEGLTNERVSGETIRATLSRLGVRWERAKRWIESPDPEYAREKGLEIG